MDPEVYERMAWVEDRHWWFVGRRRIVSDQIRRLGLPRAATILDAGCGCGGNAAMLAPLGRVYGFDVSDKALRFAAQRGYASLARGGLPQAIPFDPVDFDLIVLTDVLEHLDDDAGSLAALRQRLKPGGWLVLTVPALPWLWSPRDEAHHHRRRYLRRPLRGLLERSGLHVRGLSYYNTLLFPLAAAQRTWARWRGGRGADDLKLPATPINAALACLFAAERHLLGWGPLPVGLSLIARAQR